MSLAAADVAPATARQSVSESTVWCLEYFGMSMLGVWALHTGRPP